MGWVVWQVFFDISRCWSKMLQPFRHIHAQVQSSLVRLCCQRKYPTVRADSAHAQPDVLESEHWPKRYWPVCTLPVVLLCELMWGLQTLLPTDAAWHASLHYWALCECQDPTDRWDHHRVYRICIWVSHVAQNQWPAIANGKFQTALHFVCRMWNIPTHHWFHTLGCIAVQLARHHSVACVASR